MLSSNAGLKAKLVRSFLLIGILPMLVISIWSYYNSKKILEKEAASKLDSIRAIKQKSIQSYFENIKNQVLTFSDNVMTQEAMEDFSSKFFNFSEKNEYSETDKASHKKSLENFYLNDFGSKFNKLNKQKLNALNLLNPLNSNEMALQYSYISNNSNALGEKENLTKLQNDQSGYNEVHQRYHPTIRKYLQKFNYYDIFLVDINTGHIVYSVFKELDFATSLETGPYRETNFAEVFRQAKNITKKDSYALVDYKTYAPSYNSPASFIASPIWKGNKKIGVAIFQMPLDTINGIMLEREGMGESTETYVVGQDKLLRSDSFHESKKYNVVDSFKNSTTSTLNSESVDRALSGESGSALSKNYIGNEVISSFSPVKILNLNWAFIAEISSAEAFRPAADLGIIMLIAMIITCFLNILCSYFFSKGIIEQVSYISSEISSAMNNISRSISSISEGSDQLSKLSFQTSSAVQDSSSSINEISRMVERNSDSTEKSSLESTNSIDEAKKGKESINQMIYAISDIAETNSTMISELKSNSERYNKITDIIGMIDDKTDVINDIVFQTKLLSFNASVEAARAGEHGKGFAVVAEEISNLASLSGQAAAEIDKLLNRSVIEVQEIVKGSNDKMDELSGITTKKVSLGEQRSKECEATLDKIVENIGVVDSQIKNISLSSKEQSTGVRDIQKTINELNTISSRNTSIAAEYATETQVLISQRNSLQNASNLLNELLNGKKRKQTSDTAKIMPLNKKAA